MTAHQLSPWSKTSTEPSGTGCSNVEGGRSSCGVPIGAWRRSATAGRAKRPPVHSVRYWATRECRAVLDDAVISDLAARLGEAEVTRVPIRQPSLEHPEMSIDDAYAVQQAWCARKLAEGREVRGRKVGLTSRAMQQASGIEEPDYGVLFDDMFFDDGAEIPAERLIAPRVE